MAVYQTIPTTSTAEDDALLDAPKTKKPLLRLAGAALFVAFALGATVAYVAPSKSSSVEPVLDASSRCLTAAEVAAAWKAGTDNSGGNSKEQLCEASLRIAAGESWDTPQCPGLFDSSTEDVANNRGGLWQIISQTAPSSPVEQARMVYDQYMSDNIDYGCRASWSNCVPVNVEGNQGCDSSHTFCRRVWTGDSEHSEGYYNRQWNYVVNGRGDYNGDPLAEGACDNAYRN